MSSTTFDIQVNTQQALASINSLKGSLASLASAATAVGFATMVDDMANLKNKMSQVVVEGQSVSDMMKIVSSEALNSGASLETYANTFYTLSKGTSNLNLSQQKTIDLTSTISKALTLGSTSAQGAANAMEQLGQMFAKGYAEGDDLNTVLENSATISEALQKHYHADAGALKVLAENHKILSKGIYESIASIKDATNANWAERYISLSESMNVAKTTAMAVADKFAEQTNLGQALEIVVYKLATAMIKVSNAMEWIGKIFEVVGLIFITFGGPVGKVIGLLERLSVVMVEGWGAITAGGATAINTVKVLYTSFTNMISQGVGGFQAFRITFAAFSTVISEAAGAGRTMWEVMAEGLKTIGTWLGLVSVWESITGLFSKSEESANALTQAQKDYNDALGVTNASTKQGARDSSLMNAEQTKMLMAAEKGAEDLAKSYADLHNQMIKTTSMTGLGEEQKNSIQGRLDLIKQYKDQVAALQRDAKKQIELNPEDDVAKAKTLEVLADAIEKVKTKFQEAIVVYNEDDAALTAANRATEQRIFALNQLYAQQDAINNLNREAAKVGLSTVEQKYKDIAFAAQDAETSQLRSLAAARGITVDQLPQADKLAVKQATVQLLKDQTEAQGKLNAAQNADAMDTALMNMRIKKTDEINKLNREAANVGLPLVQQKYNDIRNAAQDAADAQMRSIAASRGITVEQLPSADKAAITKQATAAIQEQMDAQDALNKKIAENNVIQTAQKQHVDSLKELRNIQRDIVRTTLPEYQKAYYDLESAANEAARGEIAAEAARRGIKDLPTAEAQQYYDINARGLDAMIAKTKELQAAQEEQLRKAYVLKEQNSALDKIQAVRDDIAKSGMTEIEKKYYDIDAAARQSAESELRALAARQGVSRDQLDAQTVTDYYKAATVGSEELKRATEAGYNNSRTFATGWKQALNQYTDDATNAAKQAQDIFKTTTKGMEDMIVNFAKTGKFEWKSFMSTIVEELLRSQITVLFSNILNGGSSGGGGILDSIMGMFGMGGSSGGSGAGGGSGKVMGTQSNPVYTILMNGGANGIAQQGKSNTNVLGNIAKTISKPAQSGTSLWDDITGGISNFFTGNSGASSKNSSYGVLQSDQNSGTSIFDDIGDFFGGLFADGGQLGAGKWGIAGEAGPEIIKGPANIVSNKDLGGSTNVTYNINAVDAQSFKAMIAADPSFIYAVSMQGARSTPQRRG